MKSIKYRNGYKYQLSEDYTKEIGFLIGLQCDLEFLSISNGRLKIKSGYAWDGASGPGIDTYSFMRGSLVHDALYQLIRNGCIPYYCRDKADRLMMNMCKEDGMSSLRSWIVYKGVSIFGSSSADKKNKRKVLSAP